MNYHFGTFAYPFTLEQALSSSLIKPGHTLWLRGGTYAGTFTSTLTGTADNPITIRPYNNEIVIIDGALTIQGAHTLWRDLQFTYSGWTNRLSSEASSTPSDVTYDRWLNIYGVDTKIINCLVQDCSGGIGLWSTAEGSLLYGNVICYNGWSSVDRGHGHGIYTQNFNPAAQMQLVNNVMHNNFSLGVKVFAEGTALKNYLIQGNTSFCTGVPVGIFGVGQGAHRRNNIFAGGYLESDGWDFNQNRTYHLPNDGDPQEIGYIGGAVNVALTDNYWPENWASLSTVNLISDSGNTFNTVGNVVFVQPNAYDAKRAAVTIYNEAETDSVVVDVSGVFIAGQVIHCHSVLDYLMDIQNLTVSEALTLTLDMRASNHSLYVPHLWTASPTTFPSFGAFILEVA